MIKAAGLLLTTGFRALFLRRADTGEWAFPGGHIEDGETAEAAAEREVREEVGPVSYSNSTLLMRRIKDDGAGDVDFTTFEAKVNAEFVPALNEEHTAWAWAEISDPPAPLHPGAAVALARLGADELSVARLIASGDLVSPQRYGSFYLWAIRITGTGAAFRDARNEWCWRPAAVYLNDEFLARCNGLPVIFIHPETKPKLDSKEFNDRVVGTVFVPFLKNDEVWAVCRIYDEPTIGILHAGDFSTSPGVVFDNRSGNVTLKNEDGSTLLIEGKPALLDHIALVEAGVWDRGGPPLGVSTVKQEPIGMTEEEQAAADKARKDMESKLDAIMDSLSRAHIRMDSMETVDKTRKDAEEAARKDAARFDAARKDRFGSRKDGETYKDYKARHDADEAAMCDAMRKDGCDDGKAREDSKRARHDAEDRERDDGGDTFEQWAKEEKEEPEHEKKAREDKARKDAEEKERADVARKDAAMTTENVELRARLAAMEARFTPVSMEDRNELALTQRRADSVHGLFGKRASPPVPGESPLEYRRRMANDLKQHSPKFKDKSLGSLDVDMLGMVEEIVYADAATSARSGERAGPGMLIPIREQDEAGRTITRWTGDNMAWMRLFMTPGRVGKLVDPRKSA